MKRNIAKCAICGDIIESTFRHHFITCRCGEISLDGGQDYQRGSAKCLDNILELSPAEVEAWDLVPTGRLENWSHQRGVFYAVVYADKLKRFADGTPIRTSSLNPADQDVKPGVVVRTHNSRYLLGQPYQEPDIKLFRVFNQFDAEKIVCENCREDVNQGLTDDRERWQLLEEVFSGVCGDCGAEVIYEPHH